MKYYLQITVIALIYILNSSLSNINNGTNTVLYNSNEYSLDIINSQFIERLGKVYQKFQISKNFTEIINDFELTKLNLELTSYIQRIYEYMLTSLYNELIEQMSLLDLSYFVILGFIIFIGLMIFIYVGYYQLAEINKTVINKFFNFSFFYRYIELKICC